MQQSLTLRGTNYHFKSVKVSGTTTTPERPGLSYSERVIWYANNLSSF